MLLLAGKTGSTAHSPAEHSSKRIAYFPAMAQFSQPMIVLGLTGGIGMGKSAAATMLEKRGGPLVDTDLIARQVVAPGQPALTAIRERFGPEILDEAGQLRRDELAQRVFNDPTARQALEAIVHPRIREQWLSRVEGWRNESRALCVVVIPLLFETDASQYFTHTVCVACSPGTQFERLRTRRWTDEEIQSRIAAQWPIEKKMSAADFVVWTEGSLAIHDQQWTKLLSKLGWTAVKAVKESAD
jgi:dephospho-CoA kinase